MLRRTPLRRALLAPLALVLAAAARPAAADPPPSALPPLTAGPAPTAPGQAHPPPPVLPYAPFPQPSLGALSGFMVSPSGYAPSYVDVLPDPPPPPHRYASPALIAGGVTAVAVGLATVFLGSYFVGSAADRIQIYCDIPSFPCAFKTDGQRLTTGALMVGGGAALAIAGIPMWVLGSRWVLLSDDKKATLRTALPIDVRVGAGAATLSIRF
jgi:hypothetical protein